MALENNMPTYTYIRYTGMQIAYGDNIYTIQDSHSNKKYLYWSITNPYTLDGVNVRKNQTVGTYLVIINDNGISTMPPQTDISINFDGNNPGLVQDKIFGIYDTVDGYGDRFVAIETDIEGIKQIVGEGGSDSDHNSIWEKISEIEQTAENIDLSVKETNRVFAENKETLELRESLNKSIIDFNSNLGIFKSEISGYFKDNLINEEEKISIETHISILDSSKSEVILNVNKVVLIAESENQTTIVNSLNGAKTKFITTVDNLKTIINTSISDNTIVPSEITIITDLFAKCNLAINELKNTCDEVIFLGAGGSISEELGRIGIRSDEISLKVSKTEEKINTTLSIEKLALSGQIKDVENAHELLNNAIKVIFSDGEVSNAENIIISEKISALDKEKVDIDNKYDSLYENKYLSSTSKNTLKVQYDIYVNKHNTTIEYISEVISDRFVNVAEINNVSVHMNEYLSELSLLHQKMNQSMDDISLSEQRAELQQAKDDLQGNINDVDNKVNDLNGYIDGTFNDNVLDTAERKSIKNNLDNLTREKSDIDNQYNQLINSRFLDGILKTNYITSYNNFISKYNLLVSLINGILEKEDLINNADRDNMNSSNAQLNETIGVFIKISNEVIEYIARKESEYVKKLLDKDISDVDDKVNDLTNDINTTFKDNIIDESERKLISLNIKDLELQKIDVDNQYNQLILSQFLDGDLKSEFANKYNDLNIKYTNLIKVMSTILDKEGLITDDDRTNLDNAKDLFGLSIGEYSSTVSKVIEYIGKKQSESAVGDFNDQLGALSDKVDSILDDVGGALADDIIDETERIAISQSLKELENEFAKNTAEYQKIYNNVNLVGDVKVQLNNIYKTYENKHSNLVNTITYLINKVGLIDDTDRERLNTAYAEYKESLKNYVSISYDAIDSITNKGIDDAKNLFDKELGDLNTSLGNLEETMNGVFKDGVLSEAEKLAIRQNLNTLGLEKADIDKSYSTVYNNSNLIGDSKTNLKTSYDSYVSSYNNLVKVINDILDKTGIIDDTDKSKMDTAFTYHKTSLSNFKEKYNAAIDSITNKGIEDAKESLQKEISDLNNSIVDLEDTMNNAFKDGVLSDAEKLAIKQNLQTISNEKADVDKQYNTVYNNVDLIGTPKTNLKNAYDDYVSKYNSLVNVINNILNKVGLIDSTDQANLNNAFSNYRISSGVYSQKINEAVDSIAQKKADDAELSSKKYTESEIKIVSDAISLKVSQTEYDSNNKVINDKLSQQIIDLDGVRTTVSEHSNTLGTHTSEINQMKDSISLKVEASDVDDKISEAKSEIKITTDSITQEVNVTKDVMNNKGNMIANSNFAYTMDGFEALGGVIRRYEKTIAVPNVPPSTGANRTRMHFIYAKIQGDCILIQTDTGKNILIDAPDNRIYDPSDVDCTTPIIKYLTDLGINKLDYVVCTHFHTDHAGALPAIIDKFCDKTSVFIYNAINLTGLATNADEVKWKTAEVYNSCLNMCTAKGVTKNAVTSGYKLTIDGNTDLSFYYKSMTSYADYNGHSLMAVFRYKTKKVGLLSDINLEAQAYLKDYIGKVDIIKDAHHSLEKYINVDFVKASYAKDVVTTRIEDFRTDKDRANNSAGTWQSYDKGIYPLYNAKTHIVIDFLNDDYVMTPRRRFYFENQWHKFENNDSRWIYFKDGGNYAKNESVTIDGKRYNFDEAGFCTNPYI